MPTPSGQHLSPRTARLITGRTGQALGDLTEKATATAARRASIRWTVQSVTAGQREQEYLAHVFGLNLPGRDRA
jgi:hypothetical protein